MADNFPALSVLLKPKCKLLVVGPWLKITADKGSKQAQMLCNFSPVVQFKFPLKMTSNEKVLEKPSVIMTVAFRNVRVLLYALKCFKLCVKLKQVVSNYA